MDHLGHTGGGARREQVDGAVDVDRPQQVGVAGERHLGHVVHHDVDSLDGPAHDRHVADVALHELDVGRPVGGVVQVEHADTVAGRGEAGDEQRTEVAAAAR